MPDRQFTLLHPELRVARWVFDPGTGQIRAFDLQGQELMTIATTPLFGPRLAAAFRSPGAGNGA